MGSYVEQTREKYFVLRPEEASLVDLFRYLITGNIEKDGFIESNRVKETSLNLKGRGFIFLSVLVQKALIQWVAMPLSLTGSIFEVWLNLLACNGNFGLFLLNVLVLWKVEMPAEAGSTKFLSTLGHLDTRIELDKNIKPGDKKYFAELSMMASKLVYENKAFSKAVVENQWKMDFLGPEYDYWNVHQGRYSTQGLMIHDKYANPDMVIVAFRGTEPFNVDDWRTDVDFSWFKVKGMGNVHIGFMKALGLQKDQSWPQKIEENWEHPLAYYSIREKLRKFFQLNSQTRFILTGHSLGGALAILFPAILAFHNETHILDRLEAIYTFGQPRVGDEKFGNVVNAVLQRYGVKYYRFVYNSDIVCRLPFDSATLMFKHFGTCIYYNSLYEGKIVSEEPYKNYFSLRAFMIRRFDALWELLRGFILPHIYEREYQEGLLLRVIRLFGLLIPGIPAHGPQEYINAIRLGTADVFG